MTKWFSVLLISCAVSLSACSITPKDRTGPSVDVYPVTHKFTLSFDDQNFAKAKLSLAEFIETHKLLFLDNDVSFKYSSDQGEKLSRYGETYLHSIGMSPKGLTIKESELSDHFDFELSIYDFKADINKCSNVSLGNYYLSDNGCFSENARWLSIKNPEKMLPEHLIGQQLEGQE